MNEKQLDKTEEKLNCNKKYLYEHSMFWECNDGCKCQILEDDVVDLLNEQDRKINVLQNSCEIMNQRLFERSKSNYKEEIINYKEAIIEFCKFMNINSPLVEIMVDEFLQEVF